MWGRWRVLGGAALTLVILALIAGTWTTSVGGEGKRSERWEAPAPTPPSSFPTQAVQRCRRLFQNLSNDHGTRSFEEALSLHRNFPPPGFKLSSLSELSPGKCELLLKVTPDGVSVHRASAAAKHCPLPLTGSLVTFIAEMSPDAAVRSSCTKNGPRCSACQLQKLAHWQRFRDLLTLFAALLSEFGTLPTVVIPFETVDSAWCNTAGVKEERGKPSLVISDSRAHPEYVPYTLVLPLHMTFFEMVPVRTRTGWVSNVPLVTVRATHDPSPARWRDQRSVPFRNRRQGAVWRGQRSGHRDLHHAWGVSGNKTMREIVVDSGALNASFDKIAMKELLSHQAVVALDGFSFSSIMKPALMSGAAVLRVGGAGGLAEKRMSAYEWFEPFLVDGRHYIQVGVDEPLSIKAGLGKILDNNTWGAELAGRGGATAEVLLSANTTLCYAMLALNSWSERMQDLVQTPDVTRSGDWMRLMHFKRWEDSYAPPAPGQRN
eukprot:Hpha_TRINITY_DN28292_c0_g1::TRINITY_DN28292_c0_g1_i1::g.116772::m.116772